MPASPPTADRPRRARTRRVQPRTKSGLGSLGERIAARHLADAGYEILDRNWRVGRLEIDLVVRDGDTVAFVEVKTRRSGVQPPEEALSRAQRRRIRRAAGAWLGRHAGAATEARFDLVAVEVDRRGTCRVHHIPEAFYGDDA